MEPGILHTAPLNCHFDQARYGFLDTTLNPAVQDAFHAISIDERRSAFVPTLWTSPDGTPRQDDNQVQQVWLPGVHCDVGGGYAECELSNITLRWMIDNARSCGLAFNDQAVDRSAFCYCPLRGTDQRTLMKRCLVPHHYVDGCSPLQLSASLTNARHYAPRNGTESHQWSLATYDVPPVFEPLIMRVPGGMLPAVR